MDLIERLRSIVGREDGEEDKIPSGLNGSKYSSSGSFRRDGGEFDLILSGPEPLFLVPFASLLDTPASSEGIMEGVVRSNEGRLGRSMETSNETRE